MNVLSRSVSLSSPEVVVEAVVLISDADKPVVIGKTVNIDICVVSAVLDKLVVCASGDD